MENNKLPEGYVIPVHRSLIDPMLMAGCPRDFFLMNCTLAAALGLMMRLYWFFIISFFLHLLMRNLTKKDPQFFDALRKHIQDKRFLDV